MPEAGKSPTNEARAEATPPSAVTVGKPMSSHWHLPSADSIPAVSIMTPEPKLPKDLATRLDRDTAHKAAIERRKEGKEANANPSATDAKSKATKNKKEAEKKREEPGAPLQLTR